MRSNNNTAKAAKGGRWKGKESDREIENLQTMADCDWQTE